MENNYIPQSISKSGVKYFLEENHTFPSVSIGVFVKSGSRYEDSEKEGISHFLEHAVFKGTKKRNAYEVSHEIERLGGELNAYTSPEYTLFYAKLLGKHAEAGFDVLSDIVKNAVFDKDLIERERRVILEEIQEYLDSPEDICQTEALRSIWNGDPVANNPLGSIESVENITREDLASAFNKLFNVGNILVSVAGDIDEHDVEHLVEKYFSDLNPKAYSPEIKTPSYAFNNRKFEKDSTQMHIAVTLKGFKLYTKESLLQSIYTTILGGNMSSRLFQRLREESGLVYTVYAYPVRYFDTGGTVIYASTTPDQSGKVRRGIVDEIEKIARKGVAEEEFKDAKEYILGNVILGLEGISSRMQRNGVQSLFTGKVERISFLMKRIESVQFDEFNEFAKDLSMSKRGSVLVGET
jgi:predicted Zn-dependent peptidase